MSRLTAIVFLFLLFFSGLSAQELKIVDETKSAFIAVHVFTADQQFSTFTDENGIAILTQWDGETPLQTTYIGYQSKEWSPKQLAKADYQIQLRPNSTSLRPVVVIGRRNEAPDAVNYQLTQINASDINLRQSATTADALSQAGIFVQKSQLGGGSPVLRGFEANRVLLVVDGVRMNNAIYRSGHLQNAISVDESSLAAMEVIFGPGSLTYGSDALGGVIHFRSRTPSFLSSDQKGMKWNTHYLGRYATAANEITTNLRLEGRSARWTSLSSLSYSHFGDLRAGNRYPKGSPRFGDRNEYVSTDSQEDEILANPNSTAQLGSGYRQFDFLQKLGHRLNPNWTLGLNLQFSTTSDVPRYDRLTERRNGQLRFAEWYYGPQIRTLAALRADGRLGGKWADKVSIILSGQYLAEDRYDRQFAVPFGESSLVDVYVYNATIDFKKQLDKSQKLLYGLDLSHNDVRSEALLRNFRTDEILEPTNSRYPSQGSQLDGVGAYLQYRWQSRDSILRAEIGLRYSLQSLEARFGTGDPIEWPANFIAGLTNQSQALTWATALQWRPATWTFRLLAATAFRAPNIDDFAKFRERTGFIQIPNSNLSPERSLTYEASVSKNIAKVQVSATAFHTLLRNAIVREDRPLPDGSTFFVSRGDTLFTQANVNATKARIWGVSGQVLWDFHPSFRWRAGISYTKGRRDFRLSENQSIEVPLDHIPPLYGQSALRFRRGQWEAELLWVFQTAKKVDDYGVTDILDSGDGLTLIREGSSDNIELGPLDPETGDYLGVYGWQNWSAYLSYRFRSNLHIQLGLENIFDRHYRTFASGISAPGRNLVLAFRGAF